MPSHRIIIIEGLLFPLLYLVEKGRCILLNEKTLGKLIPQFHNLTLQAKQRELKKWLKTEATVVRRISANQYLPNAHKATALKDLRSGALAFLSGANIFEAPIAGYTILAHILCGLHIGALQEAEPGFRSVLSINSNSSEVRALLRSVVLSVVPRRRWEKKHYEIKRESVLDYEKGKSYGLSVHIQDFSRIKVRYKKYKIKAAFPYRDTVTLVIGANNVQVKEANPYVESSAVILLNSASGDLIPTKLPSSSVSAYDPTVLDRFQTEAPCIAALLRWWWGEALEDEDAWAREIIRKARASFGKPDSRYIRVELDPKKLRSAILYQVFLSFLSEVEQAGFMTADELEPYRQGAKEVFDPVPPEPVQLRHAEDPDVFLEIMRTLANDPPAPIVAKGERFVKKDKPLAAWRDISGACHLVFLETAWARAYAKAVRARSEIDSTFFQHEHWERDLQKILCEHELIKAPSAGCRYRYDLLENGTRDSTYVLAIPAHRLTE